MYKNLANTLFLAKEVIYMPTCHSTNEVARQMAQKPDKHEGLVIICGDQTAGRGQRGNTWESEAGRNLTFSILLKPQYLNVQDQFYLNMVTSLAVRDTVAGFLPKAAVKVKWPNDILVDCRKVSGILIENSLNRNRIEAAVVGVGLNVNQQNFRVTRATSVYKESGADHALPEVFERLITHLEYYILRLKGGHLVEIKSTYMQHLFGYREKRQYRSEYQFEGIIEDVTRSGHLVIRDKYGKNQYDLKEIEFIY